MKPAARSPQRSWHLAVLVLSSLVIGASVLLDGDSQQVQLFGRTLPGLCLWRNLTGWSCPGCGLTRSFVFMGEGEPLRALSMHLLGPVFWVFIAAQIPLRLRRLWQGEVQGNDGAPCVS